MSLLNELKRRNVFRVGAAYLLLAWILVQVTDTVSPALRLPDWTLSFVVWIAVIGFPIALLFAWAFELTPDGLKREKDVDRSKSITQVTGKRINNVVIVLMAIAVTFLVADRFLRDGGKEPHSGTESVAASSAESSDGYQSIGVLPFVNMSDDPSQEYFSDGIAEELLNALAKLKSLQVAARTSSFAFRDSDLTAVEIATRTLPRSARSSTSRRSSKDPSASPVIVCG